MRSLFGLCSLGANPRNRRHGSIYVFVAVVLLGVSTVFYFRPSASLDRWLGDAREATASSDLPTSVFRPLPIALSNKQRAVYSNMSRKYDDTEISGSIIGVFKLIDIGADNQGLGPTEIERLTGHDFGFSNCDALSSHVTDAPGGRGYRLYIVFLKGNGVAEPNEALRADRIRIVEAYVKELVRLALQRGCHVTLAPPTDAAKHGNDVRALNLAMMESYLVDGVDYYHVILPDTQPAYGSSVRNARYLINVLRYHTDPYETGLVVEDTDSSRPAEPTNSTADLTTPAAVPKAIFFSRVHFDIFGVFFPIEVPDVPSSVLAVIEVYRNVGATKGDLIAHVTAGNDVIKLERRRSSESSPATTKSNLAKSNWPDVYQQNSEMLDSYLTALRSSNCFRCRPSPTSSQSKVISMSLYGSGRRYTMGAIRNAQMAPVTYPGWTLRFYTELPGPKGAQYGDVPPGIISRVVQLGAEIRHVVPDADGHLLAPMLWRFTIIDDPTVDVFTVRDCDSRLTPRDAAVVADWLKQNAAQSVFHCIRDHPSHSHYAVSGGLWGARRPAMATVFNGSFIASMKKVGAGYVEDMNFLGRDVWPRIKDKAYCHDSFSCTTYESSHPFPVRRIGSEHLGEVYDEFSVGRQGDINILMNHRVEPNCVPS